MEDDQLELPLDERYRKAEQFALDLQDTPAEKPKAAYTPVFVCPNYCPTCPRCRESR